MFSGLRNFFYRHRRKFIIGSVLVGGATLAAQYGRKKLEEWQEEQTRAMLNRVMKQKLFDNTEKICNEATSSLSAPLKEEILKFFKVQDLLDELKTGVGDKVAKFEELKVLVFSQHAALLYAALLLVVNLKIQLSILSGYMCISPSEATDGVDLEIQETYLSQSQYFIQHGVKTLCDLIKTHMQTIISGYSLKKPISLKDIENIYWSLQVNLRRDSQDPLKNACDYLFTPNDLHSVRTSSDQLDKMVKETVEVLQSTEVQRLMESCLTKAFTNSVDRAAEKFLPYGKSDDSTSFKNVNSVTLPLARVVPLIHSLDQSNGLKKGSEPWIRQFVAMDKIKTLGANIFEAFSCPLN